MQYNLECPTEWLDGLRSSEQHLGEFGPIAVQGKQAELQ